MFTILATISMILSPAADAAAERYIFLSDRNFVLLNLARPKVQFVISYPGRKLSGICGVKLRFAADRLSDEQAKRLAAELTVVESIGGDGKTPIIGRLNGSDRSIEYDLFSREQSLYATSVTIATRSGESLARVIGRILRTNKKGESPEDAATIVVPAHCQ